MTCKNGHEISGSNAYRQTKDGKTMASCRQCKSDRAKELRGEKGDFLPPDTKAIMASYKEPLKPVTKGFGFYGTIAYDETEQYTQCHMCGNFYPSLGSHIAKAHGKDSRAYRLEFGLPSTISLKGPKAKNHNFEKWAALSAEEKAVIIERLKAASEGTKRGSDRSKALYYKNLEGRCPDQLLDKIEKLATKLGRTPTYREFDTEYTGGHSQSVKLTFGSWNEAIKILGLKPRSRGGGLHEYDRETLLTMLFDFKERYGREPMVSDTRKGLLPSQTTYRHHFGNWSTAKEYVK